MIITPEAKLGKFAKMSEMPLISEHIQKNKFSDETLGVNAAW